MRWTSLPTILALAFAAPRVFAESDPAAAGFVLDLRPDLLSSVIQEPGSQAPADEPSEEKIRVRYGGHGLEVTTADGHFRAWFATFRTVPSPRPAWEWAA